MSFSNTSLVVQYRPRPTHVFGQPLSSVYHAADVARIQVLMECGGIYIDTDTVILRSLNRFRHFEMALGWPLGDYIGTQVCYCCNKELLTSWLMKPGGLYHIHKGSEIIPILS